MSLFKKLSYLVLPEITSEEVCRLLHIQDRNRVEYGNLEMEQDLK